MVHTEKFWLNDMRDSCKVYMTSQHNDFVIYHGIRGVPTIPNPHRNVYLANFLPDGKLKLDDAIVQKMYDLMYADFIAAGGEDTGPVIPVEGFYAGLQGNLVDGEVNIALFLQGEGNNNKRKRRRRTVIPENWAFHTDGSVNCRDMAKIVNYQGNCGSCWAFASTNVLAMSMCHQSNGTIEKILSAQQMLTCAVGEDENGCRGGKLLSRYLR